MSFLPKKSVVLVLVIYAVFEFVRQTSNVLQDISTAMLTSHYRDSIVAAVHQPEEEDCIPVYVIPFSDNDPSMGELHHFVMDGIQKSPYFRLTRNNTEGWLWIVDGIRSKSKGACEMIFNELRNASLARKRLYGGGLTDSNLTNWTVINLDWNDLGGYHWKCDGMEEHAETVRYAKRSIVAGKRNNITDYVWHLHPGFIHITPDKAMHTPYAVRTDQVKEIASQLKKEHGISDFPSEHWNLADLEGRNLQVCHFWPINKTEFFSDLRAATSFELDQLTKKHKLKAQVGISGAAYEPGRQRIMSDYVRSMLHCQLVVVTQRDSHEDHYRLFEALSSGVMVLSDPMLSLPYGYADGKNIVFFHNRTDLLEKVLYYVNNEAERLRIARAGWKEAMSRHRSWHFFEDLVFGEIRNEGIAVPPKSSCY